MGHIHELIDWTVGVYIVHNNKVLIRKHDKVGWWIHVGGHVELDEDPITAAIRECKEEVGLNITIYDGSEKPGGMLPNWRHLAQPAFMNIHYVGGDKSQNHQHIDLIYFATSESDDVVPEKPDDKWIWLTKDELEAHSEIDEQIKHYARAALAALGAD